MFKRDTYNGLPFSFGITINLDELHVNVAVLESSFQIAFFDRKLKGIPAGGFGLPQFLKAAIDIQLYTGNVNIWRTCFSSNPVKTAVAALRVRVIVLWMNV